MKDNQLIARSAFFRSHFLNQFFSRNIIFLSYSNQKFEVTELSFSKNSFLSFKKLRISTSIFLKKYFKYSPFEWNHKNRWRQEEKLIADSEINLPSKLPLLVNSKPKRFAEQTFPLQGNQFVPNPIFRKSNYNFNDGLRKKIRTKRVTSNKSFFIPQKDTATKEKQQIINSSPSLTNKFVNESYTGFIQKNSFVYVKKFFSSESTFEKNMKNSQEIKNLNQKFFFCEKLRYFISPPFQAKKEFLFYKQNLDLPSICFSLTNKKGNIKFFHNSFFLKEYASFLNKKNTILLDLLVSSKKKEFLSAFQKQTKIYYFGANSFFAKETFAAQTGSLNLSYSLPSTRGLEIEKANSLKNFQKVLESGENICLNAKKKEFLMPF